MVMTQTISNEEDNWDDIEFPKTGLILVNDNNNYGLSTTTRDMSGIYFSDNDSEEEDYFGKCDGNKNTSVSSSINKVKEIMINSGVIITNNKEAFPGFMITRIGGENSKVFAIGDDWDNDMEIPEDGFSNLTITKKNRFRSSTVSVANDFEFDSWDEEEEQDKAAKDSITSSSELIIKRIKDPSEAFSKSCAALESFDADFDFSVDLNLSVEALKLRQRLGEGNLNDEDLFGSERYSSKNSSRHSVLLGSASTNDSQSAFESEEDLFDDIQFPENMDSLNLINYNDDDDFENGLDIGDLDLLKNKNVVTRTNQTQQKRTRRESFSIEFNSRSAFPLTSSEVHPKTTSNNSIQRPSLQTNKSFSKFLPSLSTPTIVKNTTKSTFIKRSISHSKSHQHPKSPKLYVKEIIKKPISLMNNTFEGSKNTNSTSKPLSKEISASNFTLTSSNKHIKSTPKTNAIPSNNKKRYQQSNITRDNIPNLNSNTNSTLEIMREPKRRQSFGDGTELDGFDDLLISTNREHSYTTSNCTRRDRMNSVSSVGSKIDNGNNHHHRKHKNHRKRKKPQLIRNLNADKNLKVVGEMVYNPITHRWDGNDSVLKDFDNTLNSTRPALISNMNNRTTKTRSLLVVGKMRFDPIKMSWNNDSSSDEEIWENVDDDPPQSNDDDDIKRQLNHQSNPTDDNSNDFQVGSEFDITPGFLAALLASERQHRNEITRWYPDALNKKNDSRSSLRDTTLQMSYLYDLKKNNNNRNASSSSSSNNSKIYYNSRSGGLFKAAMNLKRHERRHS